MTSTVDLVHTVTYGHRQRDLVLFTNKTLIAVILCSCIDTIVYIVTKHRDRHADEY